MEARMPVVRGAARAGSWTGSHQHGKGSECANLTGAKKATNAYGEKKRQTEGLLTEVRGCVTQYIPPAGDKETYLPDSAPWFVASWQLFPSILLEPQPFLATSAKKGCGLRRPHAGIISCVAD
jgi:hypothetical protein